MSAKDQITALTLFSNSSGARESRFFPETDYASNFSQASIRQADSVSPRRSLDLPHFDLGTAANTADSIQAYREERKKTDRTVQFG